MQFLIFQRQESSSKKFKRSFLRVFRIAELNSGFTHKILKFKLQKVINSKEDYCEIWF